MSDEPTTSDPPSTKNPRSADDLLKGFRSVLAALMRSDAVGRGDMDTALAHLTEVSAQVLRVERASVWRFREEKAELVCANLYERFTDRHMSGTVLRAADTPAYFAALREERSIAAHDALVDERTREFAKGYLAPLGISSMLDAPVILQGELVGVVCHEHVGTKRRWLPWEELAAGSFADFVAMVMGAAERNAQAAELDRYRKELEQRVEERTKRLQESEASVRRLFAASPVAMLLTREDDGSILAANRRASALLGLGMDDMDARHALELWCDPSDREHLLGELKERESVEHFEAELRRADGAPFWADIAAQTLAFEGVSAILFGIHDITEQKHVEEKLRELATVDSLTGTLNRRRFFEVAQEELARSTRYGRPMSLAMLDANHFKRINDQFGHSAGDEALRKMAATISSQLRGIDTVGRYGGEEFVILLPETALPAATTTMERVRSAIANDPPEFEGKTLPLSVSIGVVERRAETLAELLRRADEAVYAAKEAGRNRVVSGGRA